ncbi:MAG: hypothetical protein ACR2QU_07390 [Gammaproteobacteria bacterium]
MHQFIRRCFVVLAVLQCGVAGSAVAGELDLIVNGRSYHADSDLDWNENNYGLGLEYQFDTSSRWIWSTNANAFRDSLDNMSYMAGGGLRRRLFKSEHTAEFYLDVGLNAFLMSRADVNDHVPFPGVLPSLSLGMKQVGVNLAYLPAFASRMLVQSNVKNPDIGSVYFLQFRFHLVSTSN